MRNAESVRSAECGVRNEECGMRVRLGRRIAAVVVVIAAAVAWRAGHAIEVAAAEPLWDTGTFSILGFDPATGEVGGAVQSRVFSVGNGVLWAEADVGVAATQAIVDVSYGAKALALLRAGMTPTAIIKALLDSDPDPRPSDWTKEGRQFAVMDATGNYAAYTGPKATSWAGNKGGKYCTAQGNILAGEGVVAGMVDAFEKTEGHLSM